MFERVGLLENSDERSTRMSQAEVTKLNSHSGPVISLAISPNGKWLASGSDDTSIIIWNVAGQHTVWTRRCDDTIPWALAFSPDGLRLASSWANGSVAIWDVHTGRITSTYQDHDEGKEIHAIQWFPDGAKLAIRSDRDVVVWDSCASGSFHMQCPLFLNADILTYMVVSPDGNWLACGSTACCWLTDTTTGQWHHQLPPPHAMTWSNTATFSPDSTGVATAFDNGTVLVWEVHKGALLATIQAHRGPVWSLAFVANGAQIMTASSDSTIKLCDSYSGQVLASLEGHTASITSACISPSAMHVASASSDHTVRLWNISSRSLIATYTEHMETVTCLAFSPDSRVLVSGSDDGTICIYALDDVLAA